jgi:hypothetical protein
MLPQKFFFSLVFVRTYLCIDAPYARQRKRNLADQGLVAGWHLCDLHPPLNTYACRAKKDETLVIDLTAHSPKLEKSAATLACSSWGTGNMAKSRVVDITSDQYFLPLVLLNPASKGVFGTGSLNLADRLFMILGLWLLKPSQDVWRAVKAFERERGPCSVGVHLRAKMFDWENKQVPHVESDVGFRCAREILRNVTDIQKQENDVVFLATTSDTFKQEAVRWLGTGKVAWTNGPTERMMDSG